MRGLNTNSDPVLSFASSIDYDFIALAETWLKPDKFSSEFFPSELYTVLRRERPVRRGGGVLLACRNFATQELDLQHLQTAFPSVDVLGVNLHCTAISIRIILIYAPLAMPIHVFSEFLDALLDFCNLRDEKLIILGGFNVPQFINHGTNGIYGKKSSVLINAVNFLDLR